MRSIISHKISYIILCHWTFISLSYDRSPKQYVHHVLLYHYKKCGLGVVVTELMENEYTTHAHTYTHTYVEKNFPKRQFSLSLYYCALHSRSRWSR
jgi:hypothetical protein